jgi:NAD(P)-dependent dehydrogenase (short-subunit alcohol dehydrogenase family)
MPDSVSAGVFDNLAEAPAGRAGSPDDIAQVVALLIDCTYLAGVVIPCDGGLRLK